MTTTPLPKNTVQEGMTENGDSELPTAMGNNNHILVVITH